MTQYVNSKLYLELPWQLQHSTRRFSPANLISVREKYY